MFHRMRMLRPRAFRCLAVVKCRDISGDPSDYADVLFGRDDFCQQSKHAVKPTHFLLAHKTCGSQHSEGKVENCWKCQIRGMFTPARELRRQKRKAFPKPSNFEPVDDSSDSVADSVRCVALSAGSIPGGITGIADTARAVGHPFY